MESGFPDMNMVITMIFFIVVALFLILAAKMIMDRAEPQFVISPGLALFLPKLKKLYHGKKGGWSPILLFMIVAAVALVVSLLVFGSAKGGVLATISSIGGGFLDSLGLV